MSKLAFVFPGQGSQAVGMGRELADEYPEAKAVFETADQVLGFSLSALCWDGPEEELKKTYNTQPALLTVSTAVGAVLRKQGFEPNFVAGHSLGEYSALVHADTISFKKAVELVHYRGKIMENAVPDGKGGMAAILGLDREKVEKICQETKKIGIVEAVNFNCPGQIVIAGEAAAVEKAAESAKEAGAKRAMILAVSGPFHSSLMRSAGVKLMDFLNKTEFEKPKMPIITNYNALAISQAEEIKSALVKQISSPVLWEDSIGYLLQQGVDTFIEVGNGKVLSGLIKKIDKKAKIFAVSDPKSLEKLLASLKEDE